MTLFLRNARLVNAPRPHQPRRAWLRPSPRVAALALALPLAACAPPATLRSEAAPAASTPPPSVSWAEYREAKAATSAMVPDVEAATPKPGQSYDLPALVDLALQTHPETRQSWAEAKAAAARVDKQRSAWYPMLTALAFGQYFKTSIPIPESALVSHGYGSFAGLELAWTLFDFGRREALVDASLQRLDAAQFALTRKHQQIAYRVATSFFSYQAMLAKVNAAQQTYAAAETNAAAVKAKLQRGFATRPDLLLAIQEQAKANYDLQDARGSVTQIRAELAANIGISPAQTIQMTDLSQVALPDKLAASVENIVDDALAQRPDLMAQLAELRAREAEVKKARAEFWPKLSVKGNVGNQYWGDVHTRPASRQNYAADDLVGSAMLNLEWKLFDGFERSSAVREAEAKQQASQAEVESLRLAIMRDIWQAYADTKTALEKREFALALLRAAEESFAATQESYNHGFSTVIELLSAQKDLARARYTEIDSRAGLLKSAAALVYAAGGRNAGE
ncbi:transporter [Methylomonas koyamae]|nr:transporter [Methylomonas koyamae]